MNATEFKVGDFAQSVESGWLGKILSFEIDHNGDRMAKMMGVDFMANIVAGLSLEDSLTSDDIQWFAPADLIPAKQNPYLNLKGTV